MKSVIIKGVILVHNEGTFFIEAKVIELFFEGVDQTILFFPLSQIMVMITCTTQRTIKIKLV